MRKRTCTYGCGFLAAVFFLVSSAPAQDIRWQDRVLPLPKEMDIAGYTSVRAGEVHGFIRTRRDAPAYTTIRSLLDSFALGQGPRGKAHLTFILADEHPGVLPPPLQSRLQQLPNADQAYAIVSRPGDPLEILVAANTPTGLLYGALTLTQLIRPGDSVDADALLELPHVRILDWPDLAFRGTREATAYLSLGLNAQWKLNMHAMRFTTWRGTRPPGGARPATEIRYLADIDTNTFRSWMRWAQEIGTIFMPGIDHMGILAERGLQGISPAVYTEKNPAPRNPLARGFCWAPGQEIYSVLTEELTKAANITMQFPAGNRVIEILLTEHEGTSCHCSVCRGANGYILETKAILTLFSGLKRSYPDLQLIIVLSQGSRPVNDEIMQLISEARDVGVGYYDGILTYRTDRVPMIPEYIEAFARRGRPVDVVTTLMPARWDTQVPGSLPSYVRQLALEFVDKEIRSASHYDMIGAPFYWPLTVAAWGEYLWNARGRPVRDFARAYATITGIAEPALVARWAEKAGDAAWELGVSQYLMNMGGARHTVLPRIHEDDEPQALNTIRLNMALQDASEALELARATGSDLLLWESEFTLAALQSLNLRARLSVNGLSAERNEEILETLDRLDLSAHLALATAYAWHDAASEAREALRDAPGFLRPPELLPQRPWGRDGDLVVPAIQQWRPWHSLLQAAELERMTAARLRIPDTRGERAPREIAHWDRADFSGGQARIERVLSALVPPEGGRYELTFQTLEGAGSALRLSVSAVRPGTDSSRTLHSTVAWDMRATRENDSFYSYLLRIPERDDNENLVLEVDLTAMGDGRDSAGVVTLRRVWARNEIPEYEIDALLVE